MQLAIDLGNRNIKFAYKKGNNVVADSFQARFTSEEQQDYSTAEVVEFEGIKYCIEQGSYDYEFNKTNKNYLPLLLCAIARCTDDEEIEIMMLAPAEHVSGLRDIFKEQLLNKEFEFKYKNKDRKIKITKLGVIGEGFSTFFAIPRDERISGNVGIMDIGGRTVNIATFIDGKQDRILTFNVGLLDVKKDILAEAKTRGLDYDLNTIENLLANDKLEIKNEFKKKLITKITNEAKLYKINIDLYNWKLTGGGSLDLGIEVLESEFGKGCVLKDCLYSNVAGCYNFMLAKWS